MSSGCLEHRVIGHIFLLAVAAANQPTMLIGTLLGKWYYVHGLIFRFSMMKLADLIDKVWWV